MQTKIKEHPILFSGEMVRAIQEGRKTQTRRIATKDDSTTDIYWVENDHHMFPEVWKGKKAEPYTGWVKKCGAPLDIPIKCPYGVPGDRLWVRETFHSDVTQAEFEDAYGGRGVFYKATEIQPDIFYWKPSIHMPRWASRILLEITNVRVERVQDISEEDAKAEGMEAGYVDGPEDPRPLGDGMSIQYMGCHASPAGKFTILWDSINEKRGFGWDKNPFVWVVEFKAVK